MGGFQGGWVFGRALTQTFLSHGHCAPMSRPANKAGGTYLPPHGFKGTEGAMGVNWNEGMMRSRSFCPDRYALSPRLPTIARELATRRCGYAKSENYVTVDVPVAEGKTALYGVFFNVLRVKDSAGPAVLLTIQSAYELVLGRQLPMRGSIRFTRLVELTLQGIKPRPPRN